MSGRLALAMQRLGFTVARVVFALNQARIDAGADLMAEQGFRNWVRGDREPSLTDIQRLATVLNCDPGWLAFGTGPAPEWLSQRVKNDEIATVATLEQDQPAEGQGKPRRRKRGGG